MSGKIFYRERLKTEEGEKKPRFRIVAAQGVDITFYTDHFRKKELEQISKYIDAELVFLESEPDKEGKLNK